MQALTNSFYQDIIQGILKLVLDLKIETYSTKGVLMMKLLRKSVAYTLVVSALLCVSVSCYAASTSGQQVVGSYTCNTYFSINNSTTTMAASLSASLTGNAATNVSSSLYGEAYNKSGQVISVVSKSENKASISGSSTFKGYTAYTGYCTFKFSGSKLDDLKLSNLS